MHTQECNDKTLNNEILDFIRALYLRSMTDNSLTPLLCPVKHMASIKVLSPRITYYLFNAVIKYIYVICMEMLFNGGYDGVICVNIGQPYVSEAQGSQGGGAVKN